jgi:hypothetical protein
MAGGEKPLTLAWISDRLSPAENPLRNPAFEFAASLKRLVVSFGAMLLP